MTLRLQRMFAVLCVLAFLASTLPLYVIAFDNHPYYDDFGFSATVHQAWKETGNLGAVFAAAMESAAYTRQHWQGTYTGTILTNLQPGLFSESLYWVGNWFILTALIGCMAFFLHTAFKQMGLEGQVRISLISLILILLIQFMPDVGEAFFWFNGGIGNTFIYSLMALAAGLCVKLYHAKNKGVLPTVLLVLLTIALGGGSYGGGLFVLCTGFLLLVWLFVQKGAKRWYFAALYLLFTVCFVYSMIAPGNSVRAGYIQYQVSPVETVFRSFYFGIGQMGKFIRLPLLAVTLLFLPSILDAAQKSPYRFQHPCIMIGLGVCLYCTQFAPPLHSIASIGAGRIVNAYFISFVCMWFLAVYYLAGWAARKAKVPQLNARQTGALFLTCLCLFGTGCMGFRHTGDVLYGVQNLSGVSAFLSLVTGEAEQYDQEMKAREVLLNDQSKPVVTLSPLSAVPPVFMDDLIIPGSVYDVRESLCLYYGKQEILIAGEEGM